MIIFYCILLFIGFMLLYEGSDFFVDGAVAVAERWGIPSFVIGLTLVAVGTSLPETAVSITAAMEGNAQICIGNVVGSNILNVLIILGISAIISPLSVGKKALRLGIPFMIICSIMLLAAGYDGEITIREGCFFIFVFLMYLVLLIGISWKNKDDPKRNDIEGASYIILFISLGLVSIIVGGKITVYTATEIAKLLKISDRIIGLTVVALGTSLPELFTSINAAKKGNSGIAVGNIVGSNIYNILGILGTTTLIATVPFETTFVLDSWVNIGAGALLFLLCLGKGKISRKGGVVMLGAYVGYFLILLKS